MKKFICIFLLLFTLAGCSGQDAGRTSPADAVKAYATEEAFTFMSDALNDEDILAVFAESESSVYIFKKDGAGRYICRNEYYEADKEITYEIYSNGILIDQSYKMFFEKTADGHFVTNSNLQKDESFRDYLMLSSRAFTLATVENSSLENNTVLITRGAYEGLYKFTADTARAEGEDIEYSYTFDGQHLVIKDSDGNAWLDGYLMSDGYIYSSPLLPLYDNFNYAELSEFTVK